ncbi:MAG TPA: isoprenylcysteine carboxylmethyltransferase family protein [Bacteroidota bacterium]|nr:isoprenylcysteine carboxylmethyltransferase family protein [Bacteroidota bacterium]
MNVLGIGPVLAIVGAIGLLVILGLEALLGVSLAVPPDALSYLRIIGVVLILTGVFLWGSSARLVIRAFDAHRLETSGVYRVTRNPLYAAFIVFIVPGLAFLVGNLLLLLVSVFLFVAFKMMIKKEEEYLQKEFGDEFRTYATEVAQLIPFVKV